MNDLVQAFARGMKSADASAPQAVNTRGQLYQPGIGPHTEHETITLALARCDDPLLAASQREVRYPAVLRSRCDFVTPSPNPWAIEVKMLRMLGDNGAPNDNMLKHILSPYPAHHSAVTDCEKLIASGIEARKGILIFGYDHDKWPMDPAIEAFEVLAERRVNLTRAAPARVSDLVHPILREGRVFGWEITVSAK